MAAKSPIKNQKGMAMIETLPILVIFIILLGYGLGFFGVVHTGILNSIAARTYAFETFRNRTNLTYLRERAPANPNALVRYSGIGNRTHGINHEKFADGINVVATTRHLDFREVDAVSSASENQHNNDVFTIEGRNRQGGLEASPVWIMISYGICLDAQCGGQ